MLPAPAMKLSSSKSATKTPAEAGKTSFGISANSRLSMTGMRLSIHLLMPQVIPSKVCTSLAVGGISACLSGKSQGKLLILRNLFFRPTLFFRRKHRHTSRRPRNDDITFKRHPETGFAGQIRTNHLRKRQFAGSNRFGKL